MNAIEKQGLERATKVAQVIAEHPDLPIKVLAPSTPSDYDTYWHDVTGARIDWLLYPDEVQGVDQRNYCGLDCERIYSDETDAVEDVAGWLFDNWWNHAQTHGMRYERYGEAPDDVLTEFCGYDYDYEHNVSIDRMAEVLASELVEDMPWHECIVIDCY